jgi:hypothetical protein
VRRYQWPFAGYIWLLAGAISGLLAAVLLIHLTVGLESYVYWTVHYAGSRRLPRPGDMLSIYREHTQVWWWLPAFMEGFLLLRWMPRGRCLQAFSISLLMSVPFVRVLVSQFTGEDSSDRAGLLLTLWPFMLIVAAICALSGLRRGAIAVASVLPFVVIGTVHGVLMSQQLWGSTYAIWPLLMILMATSCTNLAGSLKYQSTKILMPWNLLAMLALIVSGGFYVRDHERLNYVDLSGDLTRSKLPALSGLSVPGPWVPEFEQLVRYTE